MDRPISRLLGNRDGLCVGVWVMAFARGAALGSVCRSGSCSRARQHKKKKKLGGVAVSSLVRLGTVHVVMLLK